jgi:hypothetical protein
LILALVVGGLAAFIALIDRDVPSTDERREASKRAFAKLKAEDVTELTLEWQGKKVRLERDAAPSAAGGKADAFPAQREWRLVEPYPGRADRTLADKLTTDLASLEIERRLEGAAKADVGLAPARGRVTWKTPAGEGTLDLGGDVPASSSLVVAASGQREPLVVAHSIVGDLERAPGDWRAKEVLPATREQIERVRLVPAGGEEVVLSRKGEKFAVERPYADSADADAVDPLLSDLASLRVESFLDAPLPAPAEKGLQATAGRLELAIRGRIEPFVIEVGAEVAPAGNRYLRAGGQAFEAKTRLVDALTRDAEGWRSHGWSGFDSWKIEHIRIDDASGKLELARQGGDWLRAGKQIPYTDVGDLLYAITSARAERVLAAAEAAAVPLAKPRLTIVFADAQGGEETLTLGDERPDGVPARVSGRQVVLLLPKKSADEVIARIDGARKAKAIEPIAVDEPKPGSPSGEAEKP